MEDREAPKTNGSEDTEHSFEDDKLVINLPFYVTPVTATSSRVIFRTEFYITPPRGLRGLIFRNLPTWFNHIFTQSVIFDGDMVFLNRQSCLLYTSPSPRDRQKSRMPSSA